MTWKDRNATNSLPCCRNCPLSSFLWSAGAQASRAPHVFDAVSGMPWQLLKDPLGQPSSSFPLAQDDSETSTSSASSTVILWNAHETSKLQHMKHNCEGMPNYILTGKMWHNVRKFWVHIKKKGNDRLAHATHNMELGSRLPSVQRFPDHCPDSCGLSGQLGWAGSRGSAWRMLDTV